MGSSWACLATYVVSEWVCVCVSCVLMNPHEVYIFIYLYVEDLKCIFIIYTRSSKT